MGGDPFDIFNSIFKEFNQGGQGQGGFNFGNFQQQFRNQPKVNYYVVQQFLSVGSSALNGVGPIH